MPPKDHKIVQKMHQSPVSFSRQKIAILSREEAQLPPLF